MQISETLSQDLHKQFTVTVAASELDSRVNARLEEMKPKVNLKGFRPGKAPVSFLKKQFGKSIMGEVVEAAVNEGSAKAIADNKLKPALQPRVEPVGSVEDVVDGKSDLTFKVIGTPPIPGPGWGPNSPRVGSTTPRSRAPGRRARGCGTGRNSGPGEGRCDRPGATATFSLDPAG